MRLARVILGADDLYSASSVSAQHYSNSAHLAGDLDCLFADR